jgi:crossover junction endodeoxyribonuclease RuvC
VRALGIDPGSRLTGWGVVESRGAGFQHLGSGTIALPASEPLAARLGRLCATWGPQAVVLERNFVARNVQSAFRIGEVRGAVLAAVARLGVALHEYAPAAVKLAAVGHGTADKATVARGITVRLRLAREPGADAADALALALCHLQRAPLIAAVTAQAGRR